MLVAMAWRNLWRQPRRTVLSLFSIAFTGALLVFILSFQIGVYAQMTETTLRLFDGYAQIQPQGYADDPDIHRVIASPDVLRAAILRVPGVDAAAPRVNTFAIVAYGQRSYGAMVVGIDPASEIKVSTIAADIRQGRYLRPLDDDAAIVGETLARNLGLSVGEKITLLGSALDGSVAADVLRVAGVFRSGIPEIDRNLLEMPLARAQNTFGLGGRTTTIAISGATLTTIQGALPALRSLGRKHGVVLQDWGALQPALRDSITLKYITSSLLYATLVTVVAFIILNTLLMSALERTHEFGVLLAIGMRPSRIGRMVWLEQIILALAGCAIGIAIGAAVTLWFARQGIVYSGLQDVLKQYGVPTRLYPSLSLFSALAGPGAIALAICAGGLVPYLHVRRLEAASAMRAA